MLQVLSFLISAGLLGGMAMLIMGMLRAAADRIAEAYAGPVPHVVNHRPRRRLHAVRVVSRSPLRLRAAA